MPPELDTPSRPPLRCVIISADPALRSALSALLRRPELPLELCGEADNGTSGLELVRAAVPELAFCDTPLPDICALELGLGLEQTTCRPVFLLDRQAVDGEHLVDCTIACLLKPVGPDALQRLLRTLATDAQPAVPCTIRALDGPRLRMVPAEQLLAAVTEGRHTRLYLTDGSEAVTNTPLATLATQLDAERYQPVHRTTLIRVDRIDRILRADAGLLQVKLAGCATLFAVSPEYSDLFRLL